MYDLDKVYPLYFLVKHSRTCSLEEIAPCGNLIHFSLPCKEGNICLALQGRRELKKFEIYISYWALFCNCVKIQNSRPLLHLIHWSCLMCCVLCACNLYHFMIFPQLSFFSFYCLQHSQCNVDLHIYVSWIHLGDLEVNREHGSTPTLECQWLRRK